MGNLTSRKRAGSKEDEPPRKKQRMEEEHSYQEIKTSKKTEFPRNLLRKRNRDRFNIPKLSYIGKQNRSYLNERSANMIMAEKEEPDKLVIDEKKKEFPFPWFDLLFLPEFPTRGIVNENSFLIEKKLGKGSFGTVFCASAVHDNGWKFAIKIQNKRDVIKRRAVLQVKREANIQRLLPSHSFIARIYSTWQTKSSLYSVLQYPVGSLGDLFYVWRCRGSLNENAIRIIAAELTSAIDFLHKNDIIYRDVKLENVVLDAKGHAMLIDFGLAKKLTNGRFTSTICGTLQYMSPDVAHAKPYSHFIDWWSLAVLIHVLYTGIYPFPNAEVDHHSELKFIDYSTPIGCSPQFANLMDRMLTIEQEKRLCSFAVLHAHSFFREIDFSQIEEKRYCPLEYLGEGGYDGARTEEDEEDNYTAFAENYDNFRKFNDFDGIYN